MSSGKGIGPSLNQYFSSFISMSLIQLVSFVGRIYVTINFGFITLPMIAFPCVTEIKREMNLVD